MEDELRKVDSSVVLPYWDWTYDAAKPMESIVLSPDWFGSSSGGDCIPDGPFKDWQVKVPNPHCLSRGYKPGQFQETYISSGTLATLLRGAKNMEELTRNINIQPHGAVHVALGGDMQEKHSPNDPLFYLHHAFVDKVWYDWQNSGGGEDFPWDKNVQVKPWGQKVSDWLKPTAGCITYKQPVAIRGGGSNGNNSFQFVQPAVPEKPPVKLNEQWTSINNIKPDLAEQAKNIVEQTRRMVLDREKLGELIKPLDADPNYKVPDINLNDIKETVRRATGTASASSRTPLALGLVTSAIGAGTILFSFLFY
jgi:hypothetical protein